MKRLKIIEADAPPVYTAAVGVVFDEVPVAEEAAGTLDSDEMAGC